MEWLSENWLFVLIALGMIAMHLFGHGGHGGHGRRRQDSEARREGREAGHRH